MLSLLEFPKLKSQAAKTADWQDSQDANQLRFVLQVRTMLPDLVYFCNSCKLIAFYFLYLNQEFS